MTRVFFLLVVLVTIQVVLCDDDTPGLPGSRGMQKVACDGDGTGVVGDYPEGVDPSNRLRQRNQQNTNGKLQRAGNNNGNGQRSQRQRGNKKPRTTTTDSP